jgi:hypothetical protein
LKWLVLAIVILPACVPSPVGSPVPVVGHDEWTQYFIYEAYTAGKSTSGDDIVAANECWAGVDASVIANYRGEMAPGQHVECLVGGNAVFLRRGVAWQPQFAPYRPQFETWDEITIPANFRLDTALTFLYLRRALAQDPNNPATRHVIGLSLAILDARAVRELRMPPACDAEARADAVKPGYVPPMPRSIVVLRSSTVIAEVALDPSRREACDPDDVYLVQTPENAILPETQPLPVVIYVGDANLDGALKVATRSHTKAAANAERFAYFDDRLPSPATPGAVQRLDIPDRGFRGTECDPNVAREIGFTCRPKEPLATKYVLCTYHASALRTFVGLSNGPPLKTRFVGCEEIGFGLADFRSH